MEASINASAEIDDRGIITGINEIKLANEFGVCGKKDTGSNENVYGIFGLFNNVYDYLRLGIEEIRNILDIFGEGFEYGFEGKSVRGGGKLFMKGGGSEIFNVLNGRGEIIDTMKLPNGNNNKTDYKNYYNLNQKINLVTMLFNYLFEESIRTRKFTKFQNDMYKYYQFIELIDEGNLQALDDFSDTFLSEDNHTELIRGKIHHLKISQKINYIKQGGPVEEEEEEYMGPKKAASMDQPFVDTVDYSVKKGESGNDDEASVDRVHYDVHDDDMGREGESGNDVGMVEKVDSGNMDGNSTPRNKRPREYDNIVVDPKRGGSRKQKNMKTINRKTIKRKTIKRKKNRKTIKRKKNRKTIKNRLHKNKRRRTYKG